MTDYLHDGQTRLVQAATMPLRSLGISGRPGAVLVQAGTGC
jgi:hypothetical protein